MKLIKPSVEYWSNKNNTDHIARCARICYASDSTKDPSKLIQNLLDKGHLSMFRHGSFYFQVPIRLYPFLLNLCPFCSVKKAFPWVYISTNVQFYNEHVDIFKDLLPYEVSEEDILNTPGEEVIRRTFCIVTQISTSRELNRVSPNNISEQSTRFVNFGKKGGITICIPHYYERLSSFRKFICRLGWFIAEKFYNLKLRWGLQAQDAREDLPLCTATKCAYTYSIKEWDHILDLRFRGITGKPHPNAHVIAEEIYQILIEQGFNLKSL